MSPRAGLGPLIGPMAATLSIRLQSTPEAQRLGLVDVPGDAPGTKPDRTTLALNLAAIELVLSEIDGTGDPMAAALDSLIAVALLEDEALPSAVADRASVLLHTVEENR